MTQAVIRQPTRVFYGWWIVFAASVGLFWGPPVTVFTFSVFLKPVMRDFHAGRAAISLGFTVHSLAAAISAVLVGWLADRYGARRVVLPSAAIFASVLLLAKLVTANILQFYLFWAVLGFVGGGVGPVLYGKVVSCWFDRHRGLALGLMMLGLGAGAMIMPSFAQLLILRFGWRMAYAALGAAVLCISLPVAAVLLRDKPEELGLSPDGAPASASKTADAGVPGVEGYDALRSQTFWLMIGAFFMVSASMQACVVHLAALLTDRGMTVQAAAMGSSLLGAALLIGRVGTGYFLDRFFAPRLAAFFFGGAALGIGLLWMSRTPGITLAGAFLIGLGLGAEVDIIAYLISRYFGLHSFGKIYGFAIGAFLLAGALGPVLMGEAFDSTGSYRGPLAAFLAATLIAAVVMTCLGPYRYPATRLDG